MNQRHWCGLTAKLGTFLAGIFTILVTDMFLIFEKRHMKGSTNCSHIQEESPTVNHWMICRSFSFSIFLAIITVFICCFLLYSVFAQFYIGMVTYVVWIIFYEASNLLLQILTNRPGDNTLIEEMVWARWCGLSPKKGSILASIFTNLITIEFLILDLSQVTEFGEIHLYKKASKIAMWAINHRNSIIIFLSIITILASCFLFYSVHTQFYLGLASYTIWIILYELVSFLFLLLTSRFVLEPFQQMQHVRWVHLISRVCFHAFWLSFVITHSYSLYKGQVVGVSSQSPHSRRLSSCSNESSRLGTLGRKLF
ncbi:transmembrane protein 217 isoform X1 [Ornithorhynchus anatinus]|nr:transmembrane protein 217 isoform X1 [Ornithorhynchus anatinus]XP_028925238.1 transmembrane protein 217 isoform X1 [Ornithorhynchus anatinus]